MDDYTLFMSMSRRYYWIATTKRLEGKVEEANEYDILGKMYFDKAMACLPS